MESLAETRQRGQPSTKQLWAGTRLQGLQSPELLSHFATLLKDINFPSSYTGKMDLLSQTSPLLLRWPSQHKSPSELIAWYDSGWAVFKYCYCKSKQKKTINVWLLRVICLCAPQSQLSYQIKSLQGPTGTSASSIPISSASASNTGTEKLNHYVINTLLPPTVIKEVNFLV